MCVYSFGCVVGGCGGVRGGAARECVCGVRRVCRMEWGLVGVLVCVFGCYGLRKNKTPIEKGLYNRIHGMGIFCSTHGM